MSRTTDSTCRLTVVEDCSICTNTFSRVSVACAHGTLFLVVKIPFRLFPAFSADFRVLLGAGCSSADIPRECDIKLDAIVSFPIGQGVQIVFLDTPTITLA
jgi:hypothetical protein